MKTLTESINEALLNESAVTKIIIQFATTKITPLIEKNGGKVHKQIESNKSGHIYYITYTNISMDCIKDLIKTFGLIDGAAIEKLTSDDVTNCYHTEISNIIIDFGYNNNDKTLGIFFIDSQTAAKMK